MLIPIPIHVIIHKQNIHHTHSHTQSKSFNPKHKDHRSLADWESKVLRDEDSWHLWDHYTLRTEAARLVAQLHRKYGYSDCGVWCMMYYESLHSMCCINFPLLTTNIYSSSCSYQPQDLRPAHAHPEDIYRGLRRRQVHRHGVWRYRGHTRTGHADGANGAAASDGEHTYSSHHTPLHPSC